MPNMVAVVDFSSQVVKLPREVVLEAMSHAPRFYTMGARQPAFDLNLDGKSLYCATDGCGVETIDFLTRQRRRSKKEDVAQHGSGERLPECAQLLLADRQRPGLPKTAPLHELDASFNNTVKHVQSETIMGEWTARYAIEMADVVAGSEAGQAAAASAIPAGVYHRTPGTGPRRSRIGFTICTSRVTGRVHVDGQHRFDRTGNHRRHVGDRGCRDHLGIGVGPDGSPGC